MIKVKKLLGVFTLTLLVISSHAAFPQSGEKIGQLRITYLGLHQGKISSVREELSFEEWDKDSLVWRFVINTDQVNNLRSLDSLIATNSNLHQRFELEVLQNGYLPLEQFSSVEFGEKKVLIVYTRDQPYSYLVDLGAILTPQKKYSTKNFDVEVGATVKYTLIRGQDFLEWNWTPDLSLGLTVSFTNIPGERKVYTIRGYQLVRTDTLHNQFYPVPIFGFPISDGVIYPGNPGQSLLGTRIIQYLKPDAPIESESFLERVISVEPRMTVTLLTFGSRKNQASLSLFFSNNLSLKVSEATTLASGPDPEEQQTSTTFVDTAGRTISRMFKDLTGKKYLLENEKAETSIDPAKFGGFYYGIYLSFSRDETRNYFTLQAKRNVVRLRGQVDVTGEGIFVGGEMVLIGSDKVVNFTFSKSVDLKKVGEAINNVIDSVRF